MDVERDNALDALKGLCICLVVYAHMPMDGAWHFRLHSVSGFIYTFHIYIFVLISGFLFARRYATVSVGKIADRMLKPYVIMAPLNVLMYYAAQRFGIKASGEEYDIFRSMINIIVGDGGGAIWYLYTFGILEILVLFVSKYISAFPHKERVLISSMMSCVIMYGLRSLGVSVNLLCLPFFYYGMIVGLSCDRMPRHPLFLVLALMAYVIPTSRFVSTPLHVVWVIGIAFGFLGVVGLQKCQHAVRPLAFLGEHSLAILVFHPLITTILRPLGSMVLSLESTGVLLSIIMLACNVCLCVFLELSMRKLHIYKIIF